MANAPQYVATPKVGIAELSTANTARNGSGTIATVFTAGSGGSRIDAITLKATGTTTTGMVRLFLHDGTSARLISEFPVQAITPAASIPAWEVQLNTGNMPQFLPRILPTGYSLQASTHNAEAFNVVATGGDF